MCPELAEGLSPQTRIVRRHAAEERADIFRRRATTKKAASRRDPRGASEASGAINIVVSHH
jgi:hypothetical protein